MTLLERRTQHLKMGAGKVRWGVAEWQEGRGWGD